MENQQNQAMTPMPLYRCHKQVWALKIKAIEILKPTIVDLEAMLAGDLGDSDAGGVITPEETGYSPFMVTREYIRKHSPEPGGYYVLYKDGYASYSPAAAFEEGYTRISG